MINCVAIDDEPPALELLKTYCERLEFLNLLRTFTSTSAAMDFIKKFPVNLLFLDIQMPDISGIDFLKSLDEPKMVIFTTAYSEYAVEGFNLDVIDYLLKPINFPRFEKAVLKTKEYFEYLNNKEAARDDYLFVRSEYKLIKIPYHEIIYISGLDNYVRIFTKNCKPIISRISMKEVCSKLPKRIFIRVHRSYIINITQNISITNKKILISDVQIPVGISYEEQVKKVFAITKS